MTQVSCSLLFLCTMIDCTHSIAQWLSVHSMLHNDWLYTLCCTMTDCTCYVAQWLTVYTVLHNDWLYTLCCTMTDCTRYVAQWRLAVYAMLHNGCSRYAAELTPVLFFFFPSLLFRNLVFCCHFTVVAHLRALSWRQKSLCWSQSLGWVFDFLNGR